MNCSLAAIRCTVSFAILTVICGSLHAQWSRSSSINTLVSGAKGNQTLPLVLSDGASGAIFVWQDARDSATRGIDLYAQRLNSRGIAQWTSNGIVISTSKGNQIASAAVTDGRGGFIVVWQDTRNGNSDIFAQHVASDSTKLWTANGMPICTEGHEQTHPVIAPDNLGGAFIVWQDYRSGDANLYAQHVNSGGTALWTADGVPVVTSPYDQVQPSVISDGNSGAIVAWQDIRNGVDFDIYAQKLQSSGSPAWTVNGVAISTAANHQQYPVLASDGASGAFIAWEDYRSDVPNIYLQKVSGTGTVSFTSGGVQLSASGFSQTQPRIIQDGLGGAIACWTDVRNGDADIFAQNVNSSGTLQWAAGGLGVCTSTGTQQNPVLVTDGYNGAIVAWEDYRDTAPDIFAQRVLSNGSLLWSINGIGVGTQTSSQTFPAIVENSSHGAIVTWQDARNAASQGSDIYAQLVNDIGTLGGYSIHGYLFSDDNRNGIKEAGESYLPNWTVNLSGPISKTTTTDSTGSYSFDGLATGIYTVQPQIKPGWILTLTPDSIVNLSIGGDSIRNYPVFQLGTITAFAYRDRNHDGLYQTSDLVDPNRTIRLTGSATAQMTTDSRGYVTFVGLPMGTFYLSEDPLAGTLPTTSPAVDTITIDTLGEDMAGYSFGSFVGGIVSGKVFNDLAGDSAIDKDSVVAAWEVKLYKGPNVLRDTVTNSAGLFTFAGLDTGKYVIQENLMSGWFQTYPKPPADTLFGDGTRGYKILIETGGTTISNRDFGNFRAGVITGKVLEDALSDSDIVGDAGLAGWCVKLYSGTHLIDKQYTDGTGSYRFSNIIGGSYTVEESLATGFRQTFPRLLDSLCVATVYGASAGPRAFKATMTNGKTLTLNFGNFHRGTIRGTVRLDIARDSIIAGDPAIPRWTVRLIQGSSAWNVLTDVNGQYQFTGIDVGSYLVQEIQAVTAVQTYPRTSMPNVVVQKGNVRCYMVSIDTSGEFDDALDFGVSTGMVSGMVFSDLNADGVEEDVDTGMANVVVHLSGRATDSTRSDELGRYYFAGLDTGTYKVTEDVPAGCLMTFPKGVAQYSIKLTTSYLYAPNADFGNFREGSIGGALYYDRNADSHRDPRDVGLAGWTIYLSGARMDSTVTAADGSYQFAGLPVGIYTVKIKQKSGWAQVAPHDSTIVTVTSGENLLQSNFGVTGLGRISGSLYNDLNRNGVRDQGDAGIPGLRLIAQVENRCDSAMTDAGGAYQFTNLGPGTYSVKRDLPAGWLHTAPTPNPVYSVVLPASGNVTGRDFLDFNLGTISGMVFSDDNGNGVPDSLESGTPGAVLYLSGRRTDSTTSGPDGSYQFSNLDTGMYVVQERNIPFMMRSVPTQGNTYSETITSGGQIKSGRNFGHFRSNTVSGTVYNDLNANGVKDTSDPPLAGWKVHLHHADGFPGLDSVLTTLGDGIFQFSGVAPGRYILSEELPSGWYQTSPVSPDTITIQIAGQQVAGKMLGNYYGLFTGRVFNDLNGDGVSDPGEAGRSGIRLYLVRNGSVVDSTISDSQGIYAFCNRGPASYILAQTADPTWVQTLSPAPINLTAPGGSTFTNLDFGDFKRISISGSTFEDVNRNGLMDAGETGLIQCILTLKHNGIPFATDTSLADGSYSFANLGPGTYQIAQQARTGYLKSSPLAPDTCFVNAQSGTSVGAKNFGNYLSATRSITARVVTDMDGSLATSDDRIAKSWSLQLSRGGVLLKSVVGTSLDTANLPTGTYVVTIGDSSGNRWTELGERRTIHRTSLADSIIQRSGMVLEDTIILGSTESHLADFIATKYGTMLVRSFADADARIDSVNDRSGLTRSVELYRNFVAPANLVTSATDSVTSLPALGSGPYVVRQLVSNDWQTIGTRVNSRYRSAAADTVRVTVNLGDADTIDFINGGIGRIVASNITDDDGDTLTLGDQQSSPCGFSLYKGKISATTKVDTVFAESLSVRHLVGQYVLLRERNASWTTLRTTFDDSLTTPRDTFLITVLGGDRHTVEFILASSRKLRTWSGQVDSRWENRFNWLPCVLPAGGDSILIKGDRSWRVARFPNHSTFSSLTIEQGAGVMLPSADTVLINGSLLNNGALQADTPASPVLVVNGDFLGSGKFIPGNSTVTITSDLPRSVAGGSFSSLNIGGPAISLTGLRPTASPVTNRLLGSCTIGNRLTLADNLDGTGDTILVSSDEWDAVRGPGAVTSGSILRTIRAGELRPYRFWDDSTYIRFDSVLSMPSSVLGSMLTDVSPTSLGATWDSLGGVIDTVNHSITVRNFPSFVRTLPFSLGGKIGGEWKPVIRRVWFFEATPESGFAATLSLRYEPDELPPGFPQSALSILRLRLVQRQLDYPIQAGWNMMSLPVICSDSRKATLFPSATSDAFRYQSGTGYATDIDLSPGTGYWMRFGSTFTYRFNGIERLRDSIPVAQGWNLIGSVSYPVNAANIRTSPAGILHTPIYGFTGGYTVADVILPGAAYWVRSSADGVIVIDTASTSTGKAASAPMVPGMNRLTIVDAAGHRQTLQFGTESIHPELYWLPPTPPGDVFDVRFSTNTSVAHYPTGNESDLHIVMQGLVLPARVSWEIRESTTSPITLRPADRGEESSRTLGTTGSFLIEDREQTDFVLTVREGPSLPTVYALRQCYPNPFNPTTRIEFDLPEPAVVTLKVYDVLGREVATALDQTSYGAGVQSILFNGRNLSSGIYFYRIEARSVRSSFHGIKKMMLIK